MITDTRRTLSYNSFLNELEVLLIQSGILQHHQSVTSEVNRKVNRSKFGESNIHPAIGRVVVYIEEHLTEQLSLEKLAEEARLSKYQLIRQFHSEKGHTPWQYVLEKRIEKAKEMLEDGIPPGQVAAETGFYDQSHFHRTFKEETGLTPKEYLKGNKTERNK